MRQISLDDSLSQLLRHAHPPPHSPGLVCHWRSDEGAGMWTDRWGHQGQAKVGVLYRCRTSVLTMASLGRLNICGQKILVVGRSGHRFRSRVSF
ncbi:hypothetical protein E2C01_042344 [Portunus trituberculatus]|uniref:Uncharacterized protein n=1 Tax=Portunus trituberculatus TaxID=210409 RepID=A0A5B7FUJ2_PORTR|nr:hypothetical protein [Portunus trituberculatus]